MSCFVVLKKHLHVDDRGLMGEAGDDDDLFV